MVAHSLADWPVPRRYHRFEVDRSVNVRVPELAGNRARCVNVSLGGIRIRFSDRVQPGDRLVFAVHLPGGGSLEIEGRVVHVHEGGDGYCEAGIRWLADNEDATAVFEVAVAKT